MLFAHLGILILFFLLLITKIVNSNNVTQTTTPTPSFMFNCSEAPSIAKQVMCECLVVARNNAEVF